MTYTASGQGTNPNSGRKQAIGARLSRNWWLMVSATIASTTGMAVAVAPVLGQQFGTVWPWPNTHIVLLGGLAVSIVLLVVHLTVQQRRLSDIWVEVRELEGEVHILEEESRERDSQHHARLRALLNIGRIMGSVNKLDDVFDSVIDTCIELFDAQQASLMLVNADTNELEVRASKGHLDNDGVMMAKRKIGEGVAGWVAQKREPLILGPGAEVNRYPDLDVNVSKLTAGLVVPVLLRNELVGVLNIRGGDGSHYCEEDLQSLRLFAENIGTVIHHSEHVEWMRKTIEAHRTEAQGEPVR
jgi:putative methionine-R-sulfoxide reductase with GAF domain